MLTCPDCGYRLTDCDRDCPRCKGLEIGRWSNGKRPDLAARLKAGGAVDGPIGAGYLMTVATCAALLLYIVVRLHASSLTGSTVTVKDVTPSVSAAADRRPKYGKKSDESSSGETESQEK